MQAYMIAAAMAVAFLVAAPIAGKVVGHAIDGVGVFDPLTCAMDASSDCSRGQIIAHRHALDAATAAAG